MVLTYGEARGVLTGLSQQCQAIPHMHGVVQNEWEGCCIHWGKTLSQINMHKFLCSYLKCFQCGEGVFPVQFSSEKKGRMGEVGLGCSYFSIQVPVLAVVDSLSNWFC